MTYCATTTSELADALAGLAQHRLRNVDSADSIGRRVIPQADSGSHTDLENSATDALGSGNCSAAAVLENRAEYEVINRRPPRICLLDGGSIELRRGQIRHDVAPLFRAVS
jgi:hypothetical protein